MESLKPGLRMLVNPFSDIDVLLEELIRLSTNKELKVQFRKRLAILASEIHGIYSAL